MPFRPVVNPKKLQTTQRFGARYLAPSNTVMGARRYTPLPGVHPHPAAPAAPAAPGAPGSSPAPAGQAAAAPAAPDPRDATYFQNIAKTKFQHDQTDAGLIAQRETGKLNTQKALALMAERHPEDISAAKNAANKAGLFYSGALGKNLGDIEVNYARQRQGASDQQSQLEASIAAQISANDAQLGPNGLAYGDEFLGSIDRQSQRDQERGVPDGDLGAAIRRLMAAQKSGGAAPHVVSSVRQPTTHGAAPARGTWARRPWGQGYMNPLTRYLGGGHPARNRR